MDEPVESLERSGAAAAVESGSASPDRSPSDRIREAERARDRALVAEALGGHLDAFNGLVELYQDYLFALVYRVVNDREGAADVVQEALLSAYRNLRAFRGDSFRSWLTRIALNAATDLLRARKRRPADPYPEWEDDAWQPPAPTELEPDRIAVRTARGRALVAALGQITTDQRTAIVLFDVEGYDYQEIADMTGVSLGTVKSRIHRGRLALREVLTGQMELFRE